MRQKAFPIFFDILSHLFVDRDECIKIPYQLDGTDGTLEFMPLKYIRKTMRETAISVAEETEEDMTEEEIDLYTELLINHRNQSEFEEADENVKQLFEKHEQLLRMFKPIDCPLYGVGFNTSKEKEDVNE